MTKLMLVLASTVATLLLLEIVCQFLPVTDAMFGEPVNAGTPVARHAPDRTFDYSRSASLAMANRVRTNNAGFVNREDYDARDARPLIAFIGDSQIEALMVPQESTVVSRAQRALAPRARAYSFAMSGAPLSQYLAYAAWARASFAPRALVITVMHNDYDESLLAYKQAPGFHYFAPDSAGALRLTRIDRARADLKTRVVMKSALARYLAINVGLMHGAAVLDNPFRRKRERRDRDMFVAHTSSAAGMKRLTASKQAVDAFLEQLPGASGLTPDRVLFLIDGVRPQLYDSTDLARVRSSYAVQMRDYFMTAARARGFGVTDLQPRFSAHFRQHHARFESPHDGHWNALGHAVAFEAVREWPIFEEP